MVYMVWLAAILSIWLRAALASTRIAERQKVNKLSRNNCCIGTRMTWN